MAERDSPLSPDDVRRLFDEWYGIALTDTRARAVAEEANALERATREAAGGLPFDLDPAAFARRLQALKKGPTGE